MKTLTLEHIKKFPEKLKRFKYVYIWSGQWKAWWRKGGGYTEYIEAAEKFEPQSAYRRTSHCGKEKKISYHEYSMNKIEN
jgi:hypothetical protein